jgi:hypothetical protein
MPERIQLSRQKGWRKPENTVVVARPSKWGNPFRVIFGSVVGLPWSDARKGFGARVIGIDSLGLEVLYSSHSSQHAAVEHAVGLFRSYCGVTRRDDPERFEAWISPLRGKNLACWCRSDQPCHADVLAELANA